VAHNPRWPTGRPLLTSMTEYELALDGFSDSVREVVSQLGAEPTVWAFADALLRHDGGLWGSATLPLASRPGEARAAELWLDRVRTLFDADAVTASKATVINLRLTLLALARLDEGLDGVLRSSGLSSRIERELGFELDAVFWPWALPPRTTTFVELLRLRNGVSVHACGVARDVPVVATVDRDGNARVWDLDTGEVRDERRVGTGAVSCGIGPDGAMLLIAGLRGSAVWEVEAVGSEGVARRFVGLDGTVRRCMFGSSGHLFAVVRTDGGVEVRDMAGTQRRLPSDGEPVRGCAFSPDEGTLATIGADGAARLWDVGSLRQVASLAPRDHDGKPIPLTCCAFSPDGRLLAVSRGDGATVLWDGTYDWMVAEGGDEAIRACTFSPDGRSLVTIRMDGAVRICDVASGREIAELDASDRQTAAPLGQVRPLVEARLGAETPTCDFTADGRLVVSDRRSGIVTVFDEVSAGARLAAIAPDTIGGVDLVGVGADADALANIIAAAATAPPLSIGLFGDWGSGKSFLINEIQARVRQLSRGSRNAASSAYCAQVRNVEFNAWHYADANLWASLVTHIFDELAKPEPEAGVSDEKTARAQVARLEEELAASATLQQRFEQAQRRAARLAARKQLLRWTWRLAGADEGSLAQVDRNVATIQGSLRLLVPAGPARALVVLVVLTVVAAVAAVVAVVGVDGVAALAGGVAAAAGVALSWLRVARGRVRRLVHEAGSRTQVAELRDAGIDEQLADARQAERELRREVDDLRSGRRIARFVSDGSGLADYRTQLGLVSQIHDDFEEMSRILRRQSASAPAAGEFGTDTELPQIDRIVLYIDDLDRCPPQRVVEVLEAVHLILAVELFVVVLAVDPRWLLQSLQLHYSELLTLGDDSSPADEAAWRSTPLHYLEKIIQMPFALRPMGTASVQSLVHGLLPLEPAADSRAAAADGGDLVAAPLTALQGPQSPVRTGSPAPVMLGRPAPTGARGSRMRPVTLALTKAERDFAVRAAGVLATPRTIKKFTNLYRLLRAGLDDPGGQLDRFLTDDGADAPEYRAVLIMLAMIIAFPDEASDALRALGDLGADVPTDTRPWRAYVGDLRARDSRFEELTAFLESMTPGMDSRAAWTVEPFRRWALDVSRYSFATGQEVFARACASRDAPLADQGQLGTRSSPSG
jgi:hypothetical protein